MCTVFIDIMERPVSDIFSTFVFYNIMEVTFIISPRVSSRQDDYERANPCSFMGIGFLKFAPLIANPLLFLIHNGEPRYFPKLPHLSWVALHLRPWVGDPIPQASILWLFILSIEREATYSNGGMKTSHLKSLAVRGWLPGRRRIRCRMPAQSSTS